MKKLKSQHWRSLILLAIISVLSSACNDQQIEGPIEVIIEIDESSVAEIIAVALSEDDGGFADQVDVLIDYLSEECGFSEEESFEESSNFLGRSIEIDYVIETTVKCDENDQFVELAYSLESSREAELTRLDVQSKTSSEWTLSENIDIEYQLTGIYDYQGEEEFKIEEEERFSTLLAFQSNDLVVNRDGDFLEGAMTLDFNVSSSSEAFGDGTGTLTVTDINLGLLDASTFEFLYQIDLQTGEVTQIER